MHVNTATKAGVAVVATLALSLGGFVAAEAVYPVGAKPTASTSGSFSTGGKSITVSGAGFNIGATVTVTIGSSKATTKSKLSGSKTTYSTSIKLPSTAGKYTLKVVASGESPITKSITVGSTYSAASAKGTKITKKTTTKTSVTVKGAKGSTVTVKITGPKGSKALTKTVSLKSGSSKISYTGAKKKGTYKVTITYKATSTKYGSKSYTATFSKTK